MSPRRYLDYGTIGNPNPNSSPPTGMGCAELTQLVDAAPEGDGWLHEIEYDGYCMMARLDRGAVKLLTCAVLTFS